MLKSRSESSSSSADKIFSGVRFVLFGFDSVSEAQVCNIVPFALLKLKITSFCLDWWFYFICSIEMSLYGEVESMLVDMILALLMWLSLVLSM